MKTKEPTYTLTLFVRYSESGYYYVKKTIDSLSGCELCEKIYDKVIGKNITGEITFQLKKIKGKVKDLKFSFRIIEDFVQIHDGREWIYAKFLDLLSEVIDIDELKKWAGKSKFIIIVKQGISL